jgi:hypothetical protein
MDMVESINAALEPLKQSLAASDRVPVIPEPTLASQFHGLNLHQLVQLTAAPALAVVSREPAADGSHRERFTVDGTDEQRCGIVARQLVLDGVSPLNGGDIREVCISGANGPGRMFVRDKNDVIYRLIDGQAAVDEELTALLRRRHPAFPERRSTDGSAAGDEGRTLTEMFEEMLEGSVALQARNGTTARVIGQLIEASGRPDLAAAIAVTEPEALAAAFGEILAASRQVDGLAQAITSRIEAVLRLARSAADRPDRPGTAPSPELPVRRPEQAELMPFLHEPF